MEQWKPVVGFENVYEVSDRGRVKRVVPSKGAVPGRVLKPGDNGRGYPLVALSRGNNVKRLTVHRLVARAFHGPPPTPKHEVNHRNGDKTDNRASNLEWVTRGENNRHAYRELGRTSNPPMQKGEAHSRAKLTEADVREIRRRYAEGGITYVALGLEYGIALSHVFRIITRKAWAHVTG